MQGVDWTGLEQERQTGWHRRLHLYSYPFYYVEYGLAQLGAIQVWGNAIKDQSGAVRHIDYGGSPGWDGALLPAGVVINEVLSRTTASVDNLSDSIEILNTSDDMIVINNGWLSDSNRNLFKFEIPAGTTLNPGEYET